MEETLKKIFSKILHVSEDQIVDSLEYNDIPSWDSIGHVAIIADIEKTFNIALNAEDIVSMDTFLKVKQTLGKYLYE